MGRNGLKIRNRVWQLGHIRWGVCDIIYQLCNDSFILNGNSNDSYGHLIPPIAGPSDGLFSWMSNSGELFMTLLHLKNSNPLWQKWRYFKFCWYHFISGKLYLHYCKIWWGKFNEKFKFRCIWFMHFILSLLLQIVAIGIIFVLLTKLTLAKYPSSGNHYLKKILTLQAPTPQNGNHTHTICRKKPTNCLSVLTILWDCRLKG